MADREHSPEERLFSFNEMCRWRAWRDLARIHPRPFGKEWPPEALIEIVPLLRELAAGLFVARRDGEIVPTHYWREVLAKAERADFQDTNPLSRLMILATKWAHDVLILDEIQWPSLLRWLEPPKPEPGKPPEPVETAPRSEQLPESEMSPEREQSREPGSEQRPWSEKLPEPEPPLETVEPEARKPEAEPEAPRVPNEENDLNTVERLVRVLPEAWSEGRPRVLVKGRSKLLPVKEMTAQLRKKLNDEKRDFPFEQRSVERALQKLAEAEWGRK
jgi:hypothetical protein